MYMDIFHESQKYLVLNSEPASTVHIWWMLFIGGYLFIWHPVQGNPHIVFLHEINLFQFNLNVMQKVYTFVKND